jgi:hypothetical protein
MSEQTQDRPTYTADFIKDDWDKAVFLDSLHSDNLMTALVGLGAEFWAMRQRMMALEKLLEEKGVVQRKAVEAFQFTGDEKLASETERDSYVNRVFSVLTRQGKRLDGTIPTARVKPLNNG